MATGRPEEKERGSRKANGQHRRNRRQGRTGRREKKNRRLSSQNRKRSGRKKADRKGKARKRSGREEAEKKGSTGGTAVGAKPGRAKGNEQKAEYLELEGRHERSGRRERGNCGSESGGGHGRSHCEAEIGREGKEETEAE